MSNRIRIIFVFVVLVCVAFCLFPSKRAESQTGGAVLRLRVRVKVGDATRGLSRKRFFLAKGTLEQKKTVLDMIEGQNAQSRDCYYRAAGASEQLLKWLNDNDCETVYCREIESADVEGANAVPEFVRAVNAGEKEYGNRDLARKWASVNLPDKLRDGFYRQRQTELQAILKVAEERAGTKVLSVMTDRNGTAYFTDVEPGTYTLSNILPTEIGGNTLLWNCEVQIKPDERAFEKPYLLSNRKDKNVKCVAVEKPLPPCTAAK